MDGHRNARLVPRRMGRDDGRNDVSVGFTDGRLVLPYDQGAVRDFSTPLCAGLSRDVGCRRSTRLCHRIRRRSNRGRRALVESRRTLGRGCNVIGRRRVRTDTAQGRLSG